MINFTIYAHKVLMNKEKKDMVLFIIKKVPLPKSTAPSEDGDVCMIVSGMDGLRISHILEGSHNASQASN